MLVSITTLQFGGTLLNQTLPAETRYAITNLNVLANATSTMSGSNPSLRLGSGTSGSLTVAGTLFITPGKTLNVCGPLVGTNPPASPGFIDGLDGITSTVNLRTTLSGQVTVFNGSVLQQNQSSAVTGC